LVASGVRWIESPNSALCCGYEGPPPEAQGWRAATAERCAEVLAPGLEKHECGVFVEDSGQGQGAAPSSVRAGANDYEIAFDGGSAVVSEARREQIAAVHTAYVKGRCAWALIAGQVSAGEARRGLGKLAFERARAVADALVGLGVPAQDARAFEKPDFLRTPDAAARTLLKPGAYALVRCDARRPPPPRDCPHGGDATCTAGATIRTVIWEPAPNDVELRVCLHAKCSSQRFWLAPHTGLISQLAGSLRAALYMQDGITGYGVERRRGFFIEVRAAIGSADLADGDAYDLAVFAGGRELTEYGVKRSAVYREWVPEHAPNMKCRDASFPGRKAWFNDAQLRTEFW
jgi:hypothetical protein